MPASAGASQKWQQLRALAITTAVSAAVAVFSSAVTPAVTKLQSTASAAFTPEHAALGGAVLGVAVVANLLLVGRVLGISGAVKGLVQSDWQPWRAAFLVGLLGAAPLLAVFMPSSFEVLPPTITLARSLLSGVLVGLGSALGNGCTSGHGICGNARLAPRSMAYTAIFMAAGMAAATLTHSAAAMGLPATRLPFVHLQGADFNKGLSILNTSICVFSLLALVARSLKSTPHQLAPAPAPDAATTTTAATTTATTTTTTSLTPAASIPAVPIMNPDKTNKVPLQAVQLLSSVAIGAAFAAGLALSGMTRPSKVVAFLSVTSPAWDASLMFVMATALLISTPVYQFVLGRFGSGLLSSLTAAPLLAPSYTLPPTSTASKIDPQLVAGGILFGAGWGLSGMCPGPALVAGVARPSMQVGTYLVGMVLGMAADPLLRSVLAPKQKGKAAA